MIEKVKVIIGYIEENYHNDLSIEKVEELTNLSYDYFRSQFKKIVGLTLNKYRIRRQLTLIIAEINESKKTITESNLFPWKNDNSFRTTFKKEFGLKPKEVLVNIDEFELQEKFDTTEWSKEDIIINNLLEEFGGANNALKYLLSLRPYRIKGISTIFNLDIDECIELFISETYGKISEEKSRKLKKHVKLYYDLEQSYSIINKEFFGPRYIFVKRSLINKLLEFPDIKVEYSPSELRTLWSFSKDIERTRKMNEDNDRKDYMVSVPNELIGNPKIPQMMGRVLRELIFQDCGTEVYKTMEQLREKIMVDYNKPIELNQESDLYEEEYLYEKLELDTLITTLNNLLIQGILYLTPLNENEIVVL